MTVLLDFNKTAERWKRYGDEYMKEARFHYVDFTKNVLTLTTFLLGFNIIWLQLVEVDKLCYIERIIFFLTFIFLTLSLTAGVILLREFNSIMNNFGEQYENKSEKLYQYMFKTGKNSGIQYPHLSDEGHKDNYETNPWQSQFQIVMFFLGLLSSVLLAGILLFL